MHQVRDMTGDGGVLKRRVRAGVGEFPVDCPLNDTTMQIHYKARIARPAGAAAGAAGGGGDGGPDADGWLYDSRARAALAAAAESNGGGGGDSDSNGNAAPVAALEVDTGCGELPEAVELCARLMVPGEVARAMAQPRYAYQVRG